MDGGGTAVIERCYIKMIHRDVPNWTGRGLSKGTSRKANDGGKDHEPRIIIPLRLPAAQASLA
jgi:hypothetical protein